MSYKLKTINPSFGNEGEQEVPLCVLRVLGGLKTFFKTTKVAVNVFVALKPNSV